MNGRCFIEYIRILSLLSSLHGFCRLKLLEIIAIHVLVRSGYLLFLHGRRVGKIVTPVVAYRFSEAITTITFVKNKKKQIKTAE